jgi:hypothetical protein
LAGAAHALLLVLIGVEVARWYETAAEALCNKDPAYSADPSQEWRALEWTRDAALAIGWAAYGLVAVGLAAVLRRALHHAMALVAFGASFFVLAMSVWRYDLPALESVAAWNVVGLTFAAVVACLAAAALVSHYTAAGIALGRAPAIAYELLAFAAVLGLYLTELLRASQYMEGHDIDCNEATWHALAAAGFAVVGGVLALRGLGVASLAHCVAGLAALAAGIVILLAMAVSGYEGYATPLWQPRGVAFILLIGALALVGIGCGRRGPVGSPERNVLAPVLAVVAHAMVLVLFTLEAEDFWASHIDQWFKDMPAHAWYARQATLSVGYALYAFGLLAAGIRRRQALLRILALVLLGGTLAKVMLLDLSKLEAIWRILSLGGLGLLLLAASLLYHKYRGIIFRTESAPKAEKEDPDAKA